MAGNKKKARKEAEGKKNRPVTPGEARVAEAPPGGPAKSLTISRAEPLADHTDRVIGEWLRELPAMEVSPLAVFTRLSRLQALVRPQIEEVHARYGVSEPAFHVLATLRRSGKPYRLSQRALMDALQLTSGTISVRIDRLEEDGLVERLPDPNDQRGVLVQLTFRGERLFDVVAPLHLANEERLLSALTPEQQDELASLLRVLLLSFERPAPGDARHPENWIGATLAPAHAARQVRRAAGLPDPPGLLVQGVAVPGPAADAGLEEGDLIISAGGVDTYSINTLYEQLVAHRGSTLPLEVLRGTKTRTFYLPVGEPPSGEDFLQ